jgi:hypothetical protein
MSGSLLLAAPFLGLVLLLLLGRYPGEEQVARFAKSRPTALRAPTRLPAPKRRPERWRPGGRLIACSAAARAPPVGLRK